MSLNLHLTFKINDSEIDAPLFHVPNWATDEILALGDFDAIKQGYFDYIQNEIFLENSHDPKTNKKRKLAFKKHKDEINAFINKHGKENGTWYIA